MIFVSETKDGETISYRDSKRYLWLLALTIPIIPVVAVALFWLFDKSPYMLLLPVVYALGFLPVLDAIFGEDTTNPPAEIIDQMAADNYYRALLFMAVPLFWLGYIVSVWVVGTQELPLWVILVFAFGVGQLNGTALTVGHELGHKQSKVDRFMAKLACAISGYGHFCIEHNRGHHVHVATPEDCSSARFNESLYAFGFRDIPGAFMRGWKLEIARLARKGLSWWHWRNDILQGYAMTAIATLCFLIVFGLQVLPFILLVSFFAYFTLTEANYVEHYGLKRNKLDNGKYEPCAPHHSWNTNHIVSNLMLFHLQRHSDHHANPLRPYQALRNFDDLPRLPSGYPGSFLLASIPPLWFWVMNPKVLQWADGDESRLNSGL